MRPQGFDINSPPAFDQPLLFGSRTPSTHYPLLIPLPSSLSSTLGVNFGLRSNNPWDDFVYVLFNRLTDFPRACRTNYSTPKKRNESRDIQILRAQITNESVGVGVASKEKFVEHTRIAARTSRSFRFHLTSAFFFCLLLFILSSIQQTQLTFAVFLISRILLYTLQPRTA